MLDYTRFEGRYLFSSSCFWDNRPHSGKISKYVENFGNNLNMLVFQKNLNSKYTYSHHTVQYVIYIWVVYWNIHILIHFNIIYFGGVRVPPLSAVIKCVTSWGRLNPDGKMWTSLLCFCFFYSSNNQSSGPASRFIFCHLAELCWWSDLTD